MEFIWYFLFFLLSIFSGFYGVIMGGAGFLNIPFMIFLLGLSPQQAVATNIFGAIALTIVGGSRFYRSGQADLKLSVFFVVFAMLGTLVGIRILVNIDESLLKLIMAIALVSVMLLSFFVNERKETEKHLSMGVKKYFLSRWKRFTLMGALLFPLGVYNGLISAGYGTMTTYLPALVLGMPFKKAIGTARLHGIGISILTSLAMAYVGLIEYHVGFILTCGMAIGSYFGSGFALNMNTKVLKIIFAVVVVVNAILLVD